MTDSTHEPAVTLCAYLQCTEPAALCLEHSGAGSPPVLARHIDEYHEDFGPVVWWKFPVNEPSYIGTPTDDNWPGYHTHWTPHPPVPPTWTAAQIDAVHAAAEKLGEKMRPGLTKGGE